jgi:hypothetical protein
MYPYDSTGLSSTGSTDVGLCVPDPFILPVSLRLNRVEFDRLVDPTGFNRVELVEFDRVNRGEP